MKDFADTIQVSSESRPKQVPQHRPSDFLDLHDMDDDLSPKRFSFRVFFVVLLGCLLALSLISCGGGDYTDEVCGADYIGPLRPAQVAQPGFIGPLRPAQVPPGCEP